MSLADRGQGAAALEQARRLTEQTPNDPAAWRALGYALSRGGDTKDAEQAFLRAIALGPRDTLSWEHLGSFYRRVGDLKRAVGALREALGADAKNARARLSLANCHTDLGKTAEAITELRAVLADNPDNFRAHNNLANLLLEKGQLKEASAHYGRAADLSPDLTYRISAAYTARRIVDWDRAEPLEQSVVQSLRGGLRVQDRAQPFPLISMPAATAADLLAAGRQMARSYGVVEPVPHTAPAALAALPRLRIGYISSDFHDHATTHLLVEALELHDRDRLEIVGFDSSPDRKSAYRTRILRAFERVVPLAGITDLEAARRIAAENIAIAVDLKGWTSGARPRILAHRPAPVTAHWLGYPGSMGVRWIDYSIVDPLVAPAGSEAEFSEKLVRLPDCYQPNDRARAIPDAPTRADVGLPADAFVFCSFNQPFKITREMFALWLDLLDAVPNAVLWLKADNRWATESLRARVAERGIAPERVVFGRALPQPKHLARLRLADLALDCAPCGSHTTASDALWAGVPHIAYLGNTFSSRVSASIVSAMNMPELIVSGMDEYRELALRLARDRAAHAVLRARVAANRLTAPLFDSRRFIRHLEAGYRAMWQRRLDGQPPDHIRVAPIG